MDKVIWSEGMFLRPQHFQQHDRYFEHQIASRCRHLAPYCWGFNQLQFDQSLLALGKLAVVTAAGMFPDGTLFNVGYDPKFPLVIQLDKIHQGQMVYLAVAPQVKGSVESDEDDSSRGIRYRQAHVDVRDSHGVNNDRVYPISMGSLKLLLCTEDQLDDQLIVMPIAKIGEVTSDGGIVLDTSFGVATLDFSVNAQCFDELKDLTVLMTAKAKQLATNIESGNGNGGGTVTDLLMLRALNTWGTQLSILVRQSPLHPYEIFKSLSSLVAEISTYTLAERIAVLSHEYLHINSTALIASLIESARVLVATAFKSAAISLPIQRKKFGISLVGLPSQAMVEAADLILAVKADLSAEQIQRMVGNKLKIGSIDNIRELVNLQLPGCIKERLPVTPRQIPYHSGMHYFRLLPDQTLKASIKQSNGVGVHISGDVPGMEMEFWVIPQEAAK